MFSLSRTNSSISFCVSNNNKISAYNSTNSFAGGVSGNLENSTLSNCTSSSNTVATCSTSNCSSGGLIGKLSEFSISSNSSSYFNLVSGYLSGGVVGNISQSELSDSRFRSNVFSDFVQMGFCVANNEQSTFSFFFSD